MRFAVALPWWGYALAFAAALVLAWLAYARVAVPLTIARRTLLTGLRALTLVLIVASCSGRCASSRPEGASDSVVAILVDGSRSMRLSDVGGPRLERARGVVQELQAQLASRFQTEVLLRSASRWHEPTPRNCPPTRGEAT